MRLRSIHITPPRLSITKRVDPRPDAIAVDFWDVCILGFFIRIYATRSGHDGKAPDAPLLKIIKRGAHV
jgi:hypothetical protein